MQRDDDLVAADLGGSTDAHLAPSRPPVGAALVLFGAAPPERIVMTDEIKPGDPAPGRRK